MLSLVLTGITALFKPYPSAGDVAPYMGLLLAYARLTAHMRFGVLSTYLIIVGATLCPLFWHLWIIAGSGNANFFFAGTLLYGLGHVFLLVDTLQAFLKERAIELDPSLAGKPLKME